MYLAVLAKVEGVLERWGRMFWMTQRSDLGVSKNMGKPPNHPILIGFSAIFTIHFGDTTIFGNIQLMIVIFFADDSKPSVTVSMVVVSNIFMLKVSQGLPGNMIHFGLRIFFNWVVDQPPPDVTLCNSGATPIDKVRGKRSRAKIPGKLLVLVKVVSTSLG